MSDPVLTLLSSLIRHPATLVVLLALDAVIMTLVCRAIGFGREAGFARSLARSGVVSLVFLIGCTAVLTAIMAVPVWWLLHQPSAATALGSSLAVLAALYVFWRLWPALALPFEWDDAYPRGDGESWLFGALRRSISFAWHLTRDFRSNLFQGLPPAVGILLIVGGALVVPMAGDRISDGTRVLAGLLYVAVVVPLACLGVASGCIRLLLSRRRRRRDRPEPAAEAAPVQAPSPLLPAGIARAELNAILLNAARSGQIDLALAAIEHGANPDTAPEGHERDQRSVLMVAVTQPDLRLLRTLIARGADVNRAQGGLTPLIAATRDSYQGRPDAVMMLLANGADPRLADAAGNTPLHHAGLCVEPAVAALLVDAGADINAINHEGMTALSIACANANWAIVGFLLERGARSEVADAQPALVQAASVADDDPAGVRLLIKRKAQVDVRGTLDRTALLTAGLAGHAMIAEALLSAGADPNLADQHGTTALMAAAQVGAVPVVHALGRRKVDPDRVDVNGRTALVLACASRHASEECVRALLAQGADRERRAADGRRALDYAVAAGRWHIVALLDPAYPLPSSLVGSTLPMEAASAEHLLDALRFGHWPVVQEFAGMIGDWPQTVLAGIFLALRDPEHRAARDWLLNRELDVDARTADGRSLFDALLAELPDAYEALAELVARGAAAGGSAVVARVLAMTPPDKAGLPLRALAAELLARGADAFGRAAGERTPLHLAASLGDTGLVDALLARGADPNARDVVGRTPLHAAMKQEAAAAVPLLRSLIAAGADPEIASTHGETALGLALARPERDLAYWLNWTRWHLPGRRLRGEDLPAAAALGDLDAVARMLAMGLPLEGVDAQGATALVRASGAGYAGLVTLLLDAGADRAHLTHSGAHALSAAVSARRESVVATLLERGVPPDQPLPGGGTALMVAVALGLPRIAELLLHAGADANATDDTGIVPLHAAAQFAFSSRDTAVAHAVFEALLRHGALLDRRDEAGYDTLLLLLGARADPGTSCDARHLALIAGQLVEQGAPLDRQDQRGVSPLHACAMHGLLGCARLLKTRGAPLDLPDRLGRSPGEVAALLGYVDLAAELGVNRRAIPSVRQTLRRQVSD